MKKICLECREEIEVKTPKTKYCIICKRIVQKRQTAKWSKENRYALRIINRKNNAAKLAKKKLKLFYENIRINLIQSPYLIDRRKIELIVS